jgi:hypothetical protein
MLWRGLRNKMTSRQIKIFSNHARPHNVKVTGQRASAGDKAAGVLPELQNSIVADFKPLGMGLTQAKKIINLVKDPEFSEMVKDILMDCY